MDLLINSDLIIPSSELLWKFTLTNGPDRQKINKNDSKVELIFCVGNSKFLTSQQKLKIRNDNNIRLIKECIIVFKRIDRNLEIAKKQFVKSQI
tara:strand:+ start:454 stop:735 length:282 start_codon:yes stop_codon:yes gene_type:complete